MHLVQCGQCGLVFNASFDAASIPYDEAYENRQCFSPTFNRYLQKLAAGLIARHRLRKGRILEVGCGKGDFLKLICRLASAGGVGYDTTFDEKLDRPDGRTRFYRRYVSARDITTRFDAILCRHVVEHVPQIGRFLRELHAIAVAGGDPVTVIETPSFEWVVEHVSFWDVFYEHCNYFSLPTLAFLAGRAGFKVLRQGVTFGGQYQVLELRRAQPSHAAPVPPGIPGPASLERFAVASTSAREALGARLTEARAGRGWAIWGAGAKGVALVSQLAFPSPRFLVDANPAKQGGFVPGSNVPIVSPADPRVLEVPVILVANPNYLAEIRTGLAARGFRNRLLST
ncbi:MAG: class I SAM-dependent methyltransferase [Limisphaerales bacterium]